MTGLEKIKVKNEVSKVICVGLDTDINKIPDTLKSSYSPILEFNKRIIDATKEHAAAYKLNFAFYESIGTSGLDVIEKTLELIPDDIFVIADAKRGDIGNTSQMYAKAVFDHFNFDSITISPYMGTDSVKPFLEDSSKVNFILALTSNPGSLDFEKLKLENGSYLYQMVIEKVKSWNEKKNCGIVFGATNINELKENIHSFEDLPVLLPGVGAQGGSLEEVVKVFNNSGRKDLLINVSRSIIYRTNDEKFDDAANSEIIRMNEIVKSIL